MIEHTMYQCEGCEEIFESATECVNHEKECNATEKFTCECCGDITIINDKSLESKMQKQSCHTIDLGTMGYGSVYDMLHVNFNVCDSCLEKWIESFKIKPAFLKSDNYWDWGAYDD